MKRTFLIIIVVLSVSSYVFAVQTADKILEKAYKNISKITSADVVMDVASQETVKATGNIINKSISKKALVKLPNKKKVVIVDSDTRQPIAEQPDTENDTDSTFNSTLYPRCLFDLENYFADFNMYVLDKDSRIKVKGEEIIAIRKGQDSEYPQIRINVKNDQVIEMRFYSISGIKYYKLVVQEYEKASNIDVPVKLQETFYANKNEITSSIEYTINSVNQPISDAEFE